MAAPAAAAENAQLDLAIQAYKHGRLLHSIGLAPDMDVAHARTQLRALETQFALMAYPPDPQREQILETRRNAGLVQQSFDAMHGSMVATIEMMEDSTRRIENIRKLFAAEREIMMGATQDIATIRRRETYEIERVERSALQHNRTQKAKHQTLAYASAMAVDRPDFPLTPLAKVSSRDGAGIIPRESDRPDLPVVAVGAEIPSPPSPPTHAAIQRMTKQDMNDLAIVMDDNFSIRPADSLAFWHQKLRIALTNYP